MQRRGRAFKGLDAAILERIHGKQQGVDVVIEGFVAQGRAALIIFDFQSPVEALFESINVDANPGFSGDDFAAEGGEDQVVF